MIALNEEANYGRPGIVVVQKQNYEVIVMVFLYLFFILFFALLLYVDINDRNVGHAFLDCVVLCVNFVALYEEMMK